MHVFLYWSIIKQKMIKNNKKRLEILLSIIEKLGKTNNKNSIMRECKYLFNKCHFEEKLNENSRLLWFKNDIFDFDTLTFRDGTPKEMHNLCTNIELKQIDDKERKCMESVKAQVFYEIF